MNWHTRYSQQANWTRDLRQYIFEKADLQNAPRVLEVGCGTGAVVSEFPEGPQKYGLDINVDSLVECRIHAPNALLTQGDALKLPYRNQSFDIVYCHFLLLWVPDPLQALREMKRVAHKAGYVIAFAEPDYSKRVDQPEALIPLGQWQTESLKMQGAHPSVGGRLAELFFEAGIHIIETRAIESQGSEPTVEEWELEWQVLESDLQGRVPMEDIRRMKLLDKRAREEKTRVLHVPTYFAWGRA